MASTDAPAEDRRSTPHAPVHGGRRWKDDPDLTAEVDRVLTQISRDFHALRDCREWSQEQMALASSVAPNTVLAVEKAQDVYVSTLVRLAYVAGFEVEVRLRRPRRPPQHSAVNLSLTARS